MLKKAIFDKECELNKRAYDQLLGKARGDFAQQKFIKGWELLAQAIAKANANTAYGIGSQMAQQLQTRYKNAYQYDLDWLNIRKFANSGQRSQHEKAVNLHYQVAANYAQHNLKAFGVATPDLKAFFENHSNALFWTYGIMHYLGKKGNNRSFATKLVNKYVRISPAKSNVKAIAYEMAGIDFELDAERLAKNRCKSFLKKYKFSNSRNDKRRVRWLKKAYCKQWKRLRKKKS